MADDKNHKLNVYFGHARSASTWITWIVERLCSRMGQHYGTFYGRILDRYETVDNFIEQKNLDFLLFPEGNIEKANSISRDYRGFHVIRDPRDMLVSGYFYFKKGHSTEGNPRMDEFQAEVANLNGEGLMLKTLEFFRPYFNNLRTWEYDNPNILEIKYESLILDPVNQFKLIFDHLGLLTNTPCPSQLQVFVNRIYNRGYIPFSFRYEKFCEKEIQGVVNRYDFQKMSKLDKKRKAGTPHYRKGKARVWQDHLSEEMLKVFNEMYPDLLIKTGYASS